MADASSISLASAAHVGGVEYRMTLGALANDHRRTLLRRLHVHFLHASPSTLRRVIVQLRVAGRRGRKYTVTYSNPTVILLSRWCPSDGDMELHWITVLCLITTSTCVNPFILFAMSPTVARPCSSLIGRRGGGRPITVRPCPRRAQTNKTHDTTRWPSWRWAAHDE